MAGKKCRTCLQSNTKLQSISTKPKILKVNKTYMELINHIAQIKFDTDGEHRMPQGICGICSKKVRDSYTFIKQVRKCNTIFLKDMYNVVDSSLIKLDDTFPTEDLVLEECEESSSIKQEINPFDDKEINAAEEGTGFDSSSSESNDNSEKMPPDIKSETTEQKSNKAELFSESVLNEDVFSDDDSLNDKDALKGDNDPTYDPLESNTKKKYQSKDLANEDENIPVPCTNKNSSKLQVTCPVCSKLLKRAYLLKHLRKMHNINHPSNFLKKQQWTLKKNEDDFMKIFKCDQCDYMAKSKAGINYHNRTKHTTEKDKFKCKFCLFATLKKLDLVEHIKTEHKVNFKTLKRSIKNKQTMGDSANDSESGDSCVGNVKEFVPVDSSDDDEFIKDMINVDRKVLKAKYVDGKPFNSLARKCDECGKVYKDFPSLYAHKRFVHISEDMYSVCIHCGKKYKRNKDLRNHIAQVHPEEAQSELAPAAEIQEKRFTCTECAYSTTTTTHLKLHIRRHHTGEKPYVCEICGNSFLTSYDLKKHRYLHTGEKPYKCPMCPKTFRVSSKLTKHKRVHTGERPFKCAECGKGFTQEYNLSVHKRTHLREQPQISLPVQW